MVSETRTTGSPDGPRWKSVTAWVLQILAGLAFLTAGLMKLVGDEMQVKTFEEVGMGQWFRYLTGTLELIGALLILFPRSAFWGALLLMCIMVGAILTHLVLIGGSPVPAIVLLVITATVAWLRRPSAAS